jgi:hypothetical protein
VGEFCRETDVRKLYKVKTADPPSNALPAWEGGLANAYSQFSERSHRSRGIWAMDHGRALERYPSSTHPPKIPPMRFASVGISVCGLGLGLNPGFYELMDGLGHHSAELGCCVH